LKGKKGKKLKACHVKCDACPVKFEARKYFTGEGAYFTVVESEEKRTSTQHPVTELVTRFVRRSGNEGG
jgi:uncharacterized protein YaiI (UPF0178 family)